MRTIRNTALGLTLALSTLAVACATEPGNNTNSISAASPSPSSSAAPGAVSQAAPVTLPVLDALFSDEAFKTKLKSKLELTDDQLGRLQKIASDEVASLRQSNVEQSTAEPLQAEQSRNHAAEAIRGVIGQQKADDLFVFARDYWVAGPEDKDSTTEVRPNELPATPNSVPTDTRVVVNIPAFRMDVFKDGSLVKSYKVGIGYPAFPLPIGVRKAQTIIFNPTWTPPDEPWVAKMKDVSVGEKVAAGSKLNPLGPIKIPIGGPSLIHGGKSLAKIGTFASHGCVGMTNAQIQDFAKLLAQVAGSEISASALKTYFADKTKTKVVKLGQVIPVELRYETIVLEDGKLHIYRDVYDQDTNTEENLRAVLEASGIKLEDLGEEERAQVLEGLNAMSRHPSKGGLSASTATKPVADNSTATASTSPDATKVANKKLAATPGRKPIGKNQKEVVIELAALKGKGYPAAINLDTGSGKPAAVASAKATPDKSP
jgi:lipoprotein-anchoring transpeptidase ErfK/SrfK